MTSVPKNPHELTKRVALQGSLGLRDAKRVRELLSGVVSAFNEVELDVSDVNDIDISVIQLIVAARRSAEQFGRKLTLVTKPNSRFAAMLVKAGFLGSEGAPQPVEGEFWTGKPPAGEAAS